MDRFRPLVVGAALVLSAACEGEISPADRGLDQFQVEASRIPGAMRSVALIGPPDLRILSTGGAPDPFIGVRNDLGWSQSAAPTSFEGPIHGLWTELTTDTLWVVGEKGQIATGALDRFQYVRPANSGPDLFAIHGTTPSDVWVGGVGTLAHFDGTDLTPATFTSTETFTSTAGFVVRAVYAASALEVFAVGDAGFVAQRRGAAFTVTSSVPAVTWRDIRVRGTDLVLVGGDESGVVYERNGSVWRDASAPGMPPLYGVAFVDGSTWVSGDAGYLAKFEDDAWIEVPTPATIALTDLFFDGRSLWVSGGNVQDPTASGFVAKIANP